MPIPNPSTLARLLAPYAGDERILARVWAQTAEAERAGFAPMESAIFPDAAPRFVCLGATEHGLVLVRQTRDTLEDLDGARVPWALVRRIDRDSHLGKDLVRLEVEGHPPLRLEVSNFLLLPGNRHAAKELCDLSLRHRGPDDSGYEDRPLRVA